MILVVKMAPKDRLSVIGLADVHLFAWFMMISPIFVVFRSIYFNGWPMRVSSLMPVLPITGYIHFAIPVILNKIDRSATGFISIAIFIPMLGMTRRHAEIDWRVPGLDASHNHRLLVD